MSLLFRKNGHFKVGLDKNRMYAGMRIILLLFIYSKWGFTFEHTKAGAPVAKWVKHLPADLAVPDSIPAEVGNLFKTKRDSTVHILSLSPWHRPDMTEILLKRT